MSEGKTITLFQVHSPDAPARDITIPLELGAVRLIREIGRGGMGVVYLGRHELLNRDVAVKFLLNAVTGTDDPGFKRLLDEGRAAATVRHPALTIVYDADLIENVPYLVIEYVNGPALSEVIGHSGFLSLAATPPKLSCTPPRLFLATALASEETWAHNGRFTLAGCEPVSGVNQDRGVANGSGVGSTTPLAGN